MQLKTIHIIFAGQALLNVVLLFTILTFCRITPADVSRQLKMLETQSKVDLEQLNKRVASLEDKISDLVANCKADKIIQGMPQR